MLTHVKKLTHAKMYLTYATHVKIMTHAKNILTYVTHVKIMTHVKNILTHVTHATHVQIWTTQRTDPRNPRTYLTHVTTQPSQFSRLFLIYIQTSF